MNKERSHNKNSSGAMGRGPGSTNVGEKAKNFRGTIKKYFSFAKKYRVLFAIALLFAAIGSVLTLIGPDQISKITDTVLSGIRDNKGVIDLDTIFNVGIFLGSVYILSYIFSILQGVFIAHIVQNTGRSLRQNISRKINKLPMGYFAKVSKGDILSRVTNDSDTIEQTFSQSMRVLIQGIVLLLGSALLMFITNVWLAITAILSTIIGFVFMIIIMKKSQGYFISQQKDLGNINGNIEEMYAGHTVLKAYNAENNAKEEFDKLNKNLKTSVFKAQSLSGLMMPMMSFIGNFGYVCVCIVGALLALGGSISFGTVVAFMIYVRLFTQPFGQIAQGMQNLQSGVAAAERVFEFLDEKEMESEEHKASLPNNIKGNVEFKKVHFGYDKNKIIINNFTAKAKAGQKVAIVGPTGAGKTTLINLLMRFYDVNSGDILIDGVSINKVKRDDVHNKFSMVLQDTWIFNGTLRENLVYASQGIDDEKIDIACKAVGLDHFVKTLPNGYDTILDDKLQLSQGQKQQITIARAMIDNKPMIILDEATSSIDTRTEILIQNAMDKLMHGRTSFVIAHRLSTIKNADLILVMKNGDVIEKGTHKELLKENGFYAELYNSQFDSK